MRCLTCDLQIEDDKEIQYYSVDDIGWELTNKIAKTLNIEITNDGFICETCFNTGSQELDKTLTNVCGWCEKSLVGNNKKYLLNETERYCVPAHSLPKKLIDNKLCYTCWIAAPTTNEQATTLNEVIILKQEHIEGILPTQEATNAIMPKQELPDSIIPKQEPIAAIIPKQEPTEAIIPTQDLTNAIIPTQDLTKAIIPTQDLTKAIIPTQEPTEAILAKQEPEDTHKLQASVCVCCQMSTDGLLHTSLEGPERNAIASYIAPREIPKHGLVCETCLAEGSKLARNLNRHNISVCVWCRVSLEGKSTHSINDGPEKDAIAARISPRLIYGDKVCHICWLAATRAVESLKRPEKVSLSPQAKVCVWCQTSIIGCQTHSLPPGSERDEIAARIAPRVIQPTSKVCFKCWIAARRNIFTVQIQNNLKSNITLPNFRRSSNSSRSCFIDGCKNSTRHRLPMVLRRRLLRERSFYVMPFARLCTEHLRTSNWDMLEDRVYTNQFTPAQVEDVIKFALGKE